MTTAAMQVACAHCTLPVPPGLVSEGDEHQFCCHACRTVYHTIHACGLSGYYRLRADAEARPAAHAGRTYAEFDDPAFLNKHTRVRNDGLRQMELYLEGVHCAACVWLVERLPSMLDGVSEARLDVGRSLAHVTWREGAVDLSLIARTLDGLGYPPHPAKGREARDARRREDRTHLIRIAAAGACAGNIMLLSFALYTGMFSGMEHAYETFFRITSTIIGLVALTWPGAVFFKGAMQAFRAKRLNLDVPIAIGLSVASIAGTINVIRATGEIYFDSVAMLIFLLLAGRWVQRRRQRAASDAVEMLYSLTPTAARRVAADGVHETPIEVIEQGDLIEVRAGESVPVDGVVESGDSSVDASVLTGESRPVPVRPGVEVSAGSVNLSCTLRVRASAPGDDSRLARLMDAVERHAARPSRITAGADRLAGWFVGVVLVLAAGVLAAWLVIDPSRAVDNAVALLIVTCPCALALATPLAATVAIGSAARRGVFIKGADALERLASPGRIFLDKTGTITQGEPTLVRIVGDESVLPLVASLESASTHPIARAFHAADALPPEHAVFVPSRGMVGRVSGVELLVGSHELLAERDVDIPTWAIEAAARAGEDALTPILVAADGCVVSVIAIGDAPRADARQAIETLIDRGWRPTILSGDHADVVRAVASEVGVDDYLAQCTPDDKLSAINAARAAGPVVMVGDGVNDAAALAAADVGVAVHAGAEASLAAADVYLRSPGLSPFVELTEAARRTMGVIRRNIAVSLGYNVIAATLAAGGVITPLIAAILMPLSSFTVLALSLHARPFKGGSS